MSEEIRQRYKERRNMRLHGHPMAARDVMPWFYEMVTKDFALREKEQMECLLGGGELSKNPMIPWGKSKPRAVLVTDENGAMHYELVE